MCVYVCPMHVRFSAVFFFFFFEFFFFFLNVKSGCDKCTSKLSDRFNCSHQTQLHNIACIVQLYMYHRGNCPIPIKKKKKYRRLLPVLLDTISFRRGNAKRQDQAIFLTLSLNLNFIRAFVCVYICVWH